MNRTLTAILLALTAFGADAFELPYKFHHISSNDGLSQSEVYCIRKDSRGFLWIGTVQGLNRYDGYEITQFNVNNTSKNSLINSTIRAIEEDRAGRLWIGTDYGLDYFEAADSEIRHFDFHLDTPITVGGICSTEDGLLVVSTNAGICLLSDSDSGEIEVMDFLDHGKSHGTRHPTQLFRSSGKIFYSVCAHNTTAFCVNEGTLVPVIVPESIAVAEYSHICETKDSLLLLAGKSGLSLYNERTAEACRLPKDLRGNISSCTADKNGHIYVGTIDSGLYELIPGKNPYDFNTRHYKSDYENINSLSSDMIYSLYVDDENILWIGTIGSGLDYTELNDKRFGHIQLVLKEKRGISSPSFVRSVYTSDETDEVFIGLHNGGLVSYDKATGKSVKLGLGQDPVFAIQPMGRDRYLLGGRFLSILDHGHIRKVSGTPEESCFDILKQDNVTYWIATLNGLCRMTVRGDSCRIEHIEIFPRSSAYNGKHTHNCRILELDEAHSILWVGTEGGGLQMCRLDENKDVVETEIFSDREKDRKLSSSYVRSLVLDREGRLWVGTYDGLNRIECKNGEFHVERNCFRDKIPSNVIQSLETDKDGNIWAGTNKGLVTISKEGEVRNYTYQDGLSSNEFSEHASCRTEAGILYFGGIHGVNFFNPENISPSDYMPKVTITGLLLTDQRTFEVRKISNPATLAQKGGIELKPTENEIDIFFSAMMFVTPSKIKYRYMLEGYENTWNITDAKSRTATYTNLSYGNYRFKVNATNRDGIWSDAITTLDIHLRTPLLLTLPFLLLYALAVFMAIVFISYCVILRKTAKKALELENIHNKRLHELDELRTRFFVNISHDLRTPLTLIIGPLERLATDRALQEETRDKINLILRSATRLKYMVEQLLDFRKIDAGREQLQLNLVPLGQWIHEEVSYFEPAILEKNLELRFKGETEETPLYLDARKVSKILFNLMSNAVKFTQKGYILVSCSVDEATIRIEVKDTGKGIPPKYINRIFDRFFSDSERYSYGIGLSLCKDLAALMGGKLAVESAVDIGTKFTLELPRLREVSPKDVSAESPSGPPNIWRPPLKIPCRNTAALRKKAGKPYCLWMITRIC